jgi:hypothetical protein
MAEQARSDLDWDLSAAEAAYSVIARYVEHTQISGLLIAMLASALGEERLKPLVQSEPWQLYMASKRALEEARSEVEALTRLVEQKRSPQPGQAADAARAERGENEE